MHRASTIVLLLLLIASVAGAQAPVAPVSAPTEPAEATEPVRPPFVLGGYVEAYYQWNFARPGNDVTNFRAFDNRHDTFTLANVALDAQWDYRDLIGRLTLQIGSTPSTYYASEPQREGGTGANASGADLWKYLQQAYAGYRFSERLSASIGLFLSPIGPEAMAVHEAWTWSRSNLFFGLPFYHTGARASYALSPAWTITLAAYNGWNSVVDNNRQKTLAAQARYTRGAVDAAMLYVGGVERPRGAPEGKPWRNLFDAHATVTASRWLALIGHANAGFEHTRFGAARWAAGALHARAQLASPLFLALRGDAFVERTPSNARGTATPLFWPARWVASGTATLDYRPHPQFSLRLEGRHDQAQGPMYYGRTLVAAADGGAAPPTRRGQTTLTLGATSWF